MRPGFGLYNTRAIARRTRGIAGGRTARLPHTHLGSVHDATTAVGNALAQTVCYKLIRMAMLIWGFSSISALIEEHDLGLDLSRNKQNNTRTQLTILPR